MPGAEKPPTFNAIHDADMDPKDLATVCLALYTLTSYCWSSKDDPCRKALMYSGFVEDSEGELWIRIGDRAVRVYVKSPSEPMVSIVSLVEYARRQLEARRVADWYVFLDDPQEQEFVASEEALKDLAAELLMGRPFGQVYRPWLTENATYWRSDEESG